ncbi:hypothetical protein OV090_27055 [Nannocystis sp. RBIL2]|uniref:hypothetical protein n=1 Tax=Nannocystis sp. RBIL2 TaxID=2996788 RepID=UPI0022705F77|nr:hypothetical protein [Nannocystis sp. RBIL2]MCY1068431.1 hypothetical protein [Nannocystis sp. RBIL2]
MRTERTRTFFTSALSCAAALFSLTACGDVDDAVRFVLAGKMVGQEFLLDNIEFAEWLLKP